MAARRAGLDTLKFFPAKAAGGTYALEQIRPVLPELAFCPTGGIGAEDAPAYLKLANVACVGGSFPAPGDAIRDGDRGRIEAFRPAERGVGKEWVRTGGTGGSP